jgi:hypothetical protein
MLSISKLPSAGLGNKLFSWAAGAIFAKKNNCKHIVLGMTKFHIGPWIRFERSKRFYKGYFKNERLFHLGYFVKSKTIMFQKESSKMTDFNSNAVFNEVPNWEDHFIGLREHRAFIIDYFFESLYPSLRQEAELVPFSEITVHIRMGDFRNLGPDEDFAKVGAVRTPTAYFVEMINMLRKHIGRNVPVTVFSDGSDESLNEILSLPNISRQTNTKDILDIIGLSKSKVLITSAGSTFSKWAGFLSENVIIDHFQHIHKPIRDDVTNKIMYEGPLSPGTEINDYPLLSSNLVSLFQ